MLISDSHKFIFVHIRKAAGTSIREILESYAIKKPTDLFSKLKSKSGLERNYRKFSFRYHSDIKHLKSFMPKEKYNTYFKFAFVRNPWKRLVSEYEYIRQTPDHGRHKKVIKMNFNQYIKYQSKRADAFQVNMLTDKNGILQMDFIGKMENLENDWSFVCKKLKILNAKLPHVNKSKLVNYDDYYDEINKQLVAELWNKDIKLFKYKYED